MKIILDRKDVSLESPYTIFIPSNVYKLIKPHTLIGITFSGEPMELIILEMLKTIEINFDEEDNGRRDNLRNEINSTLVEETLYGDLCRHREYHNIFIKCKNANN